MSKLARSPLQSFRLRGTAGGGEVVFCLETGASPVGSDPANRLVLPWDGVSRRHALLQVDAGCIAVIDTDSKNGTFVNGHRVGRAEIGLGDVVGFGPVELRLEVLPPEDAELALAFLSPSPAPAPAPSHTTSKIDHSGPALDRSRLRFPQGYVRGVSAAMAEVHRQIEAIAPGDLPVLLRGETGVGKELAAEIIHRSSPRRDAPFVAINCAAIPTELLEAELFGIGERVATGVAARRGQIAQAAGGTLFLDEIGEMPPELQAKLLRVLQEKKLRPLGGVPIEVDVRLVTATNADLERLILEGRFRRDLYFRIAGLVLRLPTLAERREDLPLLIEGLLETAMREIGKPVRGITVGALERLVRRPWPGNVRELGHEIRRLVYLCPAGGTIESAMVSGGEPVEAQPAPEPAAITAAPGLPTLHLGELEQLAIGEAMRRTGNNQVRAARLLGISRHVLRRRLERSGEG